MHTIRLSGERLYQSVNLTLQLEKHDAQSADLRVSLTAPACQFSILQAVTGHDLHTFALALESLHRTLTGTVELRSFSEDLVLMFALATKEEGLISIEGSLHVVGLPGAGGGIHASIKQAEVNVQLGKLLISQSSLPMIVSTVERFLSEESVSTENPWESA